MKKSIFRTIAAGALAFGAIVFTGCQKEEITNSGNNPVFGSKKVTLTEAQVRQVREISAQIPMVRLYDEVHGRYMDINIYERWNRDWTFANPYDGAEYSESGSWVSADGDEMIVFSINGTSSGAGGGGTVVAGNTTLNIDYAFCFNIDIEAVGLDLFDFGGSFDGVAGVIGIAGDFEALANDELGEDADFEDFFHGFAAYIVYDSEANGTYEVLDWFEDIDGGTDDLADNAFSYVLDWNNFGLYFSSSGSITASGASLNFQGEYLSLLDFVLSFEEETEEEEYEAAIVDGFGQMGCN
ncbi:MAG: hypothetical protein RLZZ262_188 [Bacteroidota bacterium]